MPRRARKVKRRRQRQSDSSPERSSSSVDDDDDDNNESASESEADTEPLSDASVGSGSDRRRAGAKRPRLRRRRRTAEQSEEGELVCNSDSDDSDQFSDGYDNDLLGDEEDRRRLEQMTEKEREEELFRRLERREMLKERFKIEKRLRRAKKLQKERRPSAADSCSDGGHPASPLFDAEAEVHTRTRAIVDSDSDSQKSASRQKKRNRSLHIKSLKAKREEKLAAKAGQSDAARKTAEDVFVASGASSRSSSSSESDQAPRDRSPSSASEQEGSAVDEGPAVQTRHDLAAIRLSRHKISKLVHAPFFKETVIGCFVRIGIGSNDGVAVYRVAEIVDVVETTKVYQLEATKTNKGARLRHGNQERVYRFEYVSNQDFTDSEFEKWMNTMGALKLKLPSMKFVQSKAEAINNAINHGFSEKEVEQIIAEKKRFKLIKTSFAIRKAEILRDIESAEYNNDMAEVERLKAALSELDDEASDAEERMYARRHEVAKINERNRNYNMFFIDSKTDQNVSVSVKREADDPFTRITTRPKIYSKPPRTKQEKEEEELEQNAANEQSTPPQSSSATSTVRKATWNLTLEDQELFDMHNIETDNCLQAVMAAAKKGSSDAKLIATRHAIGEDLFRRRADDRLGARAGHR